mmetsp:Transcript_19898/g.32739  ORF Transcript_19898/g.32739 Transcript_19898/m.32739 type:complete len:269 (-) Transcript_19898:203-1009(-)
MSMLFTISYLNASFRPGIGVIRIPPPGYVQPRMYDESGFGICGNHFLSFLGSTPTFVTKSPPSGADGCSPPASFQRISINSREEIAPPTASAVTIVESEYPSRYEKTTFPAFTATSQPPVLDARTSKFIISSASSCRVAPLTSQRTFHLFVDLPLSSELNTLIGPLSLFSTHSLLSQFLAGARLAKNLFKDSSRRFLPISGNTGSPTGSATFSSSLTALTTFSVVDTPYKMQTSHTTCATINPSNSPNATAVTDAAKPTYFTGDSTGP